MISLYPELLLQQYYQATGIRKEEQLSGRQTLSIIKFFLNHAKSALFAIKQKNFALFDPLVKDRCCQIHAAHLLTCLQTKAIKDESERLVSTVDKILKTVYRLTNHLPLPLPKDFSDFILQNALQIEISKTMQVLLRSHLLTISTTSTYPRTLDTHKLKSQFCKSLEDYCVQKIVAETRTQLSKSSTDFLLSSMHALRFLKGNPLSHLQSVRSFTFQHKEEPSATVLVSPMYYNTKGVLQLLKNLGTLMMFTCYGTNDPESRFFCRSTSGQEDFKPTKPALLDQEEPLFVFEVLAKESVLPSSLSKHLTAKGVENFVLEQAALIAQYGFDDDLSALDIEGRMEISFHRSHVDADFPFQIMHAHLGIMPKEERS